MRFWLILQRRLRSWLFRDRREADLSEELQFHLDREADRLQGTGLTREAARLEARRTFGGVEGFKEASREARGTAVAHDVIRDVVYALRTFKRAPLVAVTIVSTVALGLGLVTVAFTLVNRLLFRVDVVANVHEMFAVERPRGADGESEPFTQADFEALRRESAVFTDVYAVVDDVEGRLDGRRMSGAYVTGNFFQVLGVSPPIGRALTPADDQPDAGHPVVVLSHRGWDRLFARDPNVIGRELLVNDVGFAIVGVMPETFRGLTVTPGDYWAPLSTLGRVRPPRSDREAAPGLGIIGRLKPDLSPRTAEAQLAAWDAGRSDAVSGGRRAPTIMLVPRRGTVPQPHEVVIVTAPLFFGFGLILLIGCANVANLLFARSVARQRELGIRLSLGATRVRLVRQLLTESLLLALVAGVAGFAISRLALEVIITAVTSTWPPEIGDLRLLVPAADWRVWLFLLVGAAAATMAFGLAPALQATRIEPLRTIRGEVARDARPSRARNVLIGLQVGASALLLISAAVFLRTAFAAARYDPGLRITDTVMVPVASEAARTAIVEAVTAHPSVAVVAASWPAAPVPPAAVAESAGTRVAVGYMLVSPEFFGVLDIPIVRGRLFTPTEIASRVPAAVVSETTARTLWPDAGALGQILRLDPEPRSGGERATEPRLASPTFTVVGVVRDVAGFRIAPAPKAVVYVPANAATTGTSLVARVHGDPDLARQALLKRLLAIDPTIDVQPLAAIARLERWFLQFAFWLTIALGALALALTLSGLFSVLSSVVEQRTKEIGVRMALGATAGDVTRLVLWQSVRPVGIGLVVGAASAGGLAAVLLATPAAAGIGEIVNVLDPVAYAASLSIILAACLLAASIPAARAARLDPTRALRQE